MKIYNKEKIAEKQRWNLNKKKKNGERMIWVWEEGSRNPGRI